MLRLLHVCIHLVFLSEGAAQLESSPRGVMMKGRVALDAKKFAPSDVCIFEASSRLGGRTFTVHEHDTELFPLLDGLNVDVGAYRFAFEQHLPADLIRGPLGLPTACYIPTCQREPLDGNLTLHKLIESVLKDSNPAPPLATNTTADTAAIAATAALQPAQSRVRVSRTARRRTPVPDMAPRSRR